MTEETIDFAEYIKVCRIKAYKSQGQIGAEIGMSQASVSAWEGRFKKPSKYILEKLATAIGADFPTLCSLYEKSCQKRPNNKASRVNGLEDSKKSAVSNNNVMWLCQVLVSISAANVTSERFNKMIELEEEIGSLTTEQVMTIVCKTVF